MFVGVGAKSAAGGGQMPDNRPMASITARKMGIQIFMKLKICAVFSSPAACLLGLIFAVALPSRAADLYDAATGQLTIPAVRAYGNLYRDVVVQLGEVLAVHGGTVEDPLDRLSLPPTACLSRLSGPSVKPTPMWW